MTTVEEIPVLVHQEEEQSQKTDKAEVDEEVSEVSESSKPSENSNQAPNGAQVEELQNLSLESESKSEGSDKREEEVTVDVSNVSQEEKESSVSSTDISMEKDVPMINGTGAVDIPEIELIIKASTIDGRRRGACIFCQEYFMDLYLLAELKAISLKITTVDMKRPPPDFRSNFEATLPPILIDTGVAILENEKIERHIMKHIPGGHNLFIPDPDVAKKIENLYNRFKVMLVRQDETSKKSVIKILRRLDETLKEKNTRFLTGDTLCCFDCELMPKLQHIRVAGMFFLDFDIPHEFSFLWRYIKEMYQLDAFVQSCPADQDIINVYKMQKMSPSDTLTRKRSREELEEPSYTTSIPESI